MGSFTSATVAWFVGHTIKLISHHLWLSRQWELWVSFRQLSKVMAHVDTILLLLLIQQVVDMNLVAIRHNTWADCLSE